jgi:hypothetical protein
LLVVLGLGTAGLALRSLAIVADGADLADLAASIERGVAPEGDYLARVVGAEGFAGDGDDCHDAMTRANLTIAWAALNAVAEDAPARNDVRAGATRAALRRLACDPLDGNAWLRYAMIAERGAAPSETVVAALGASYRLAPAEIWVIEPRLDFATRRLLAGAAIDSAGYAADLQRFVVFEPTTRVAAAYVASPPVVRRWLRPPIDAQPDPRRRDILTGIDRLGVDYERETP